MNFRRLNSPPRRVSSQHKRTPTNGQLATRNEAMASRNSELNLLNSDLINLQTSAKLVIVLLGRNLAIRRFSTQAEKQFGLRSRDLGRQIGSIRHRLVGTDLQALIRGVIRNVRECEREVQGQDGRWHALRVRPYFTLDGRVDGAVLVLTDIDAGKQAEREAVSARDFAEAVISTMRDPVLILDNNLRVRKVNESYLKTFRTTATAVMNHSVFKLGRRSWESPRLRTLLQRILPRRTAFADFEISQQFPKIGRRTFVLHGRMLSQDPGHREKILLGMQDITERKKIEEALCKAEILLSRYAGQQEDLVARRTGQLSRRTAQLSASNVQLKASLRTVRQGREEIGAHLLSAQLLQKKLRYVTHQILTAQEEERKKISRELHDEVVQTLVGINVELSALVHGNSPDVRLLKDKISSTQRLVESSVDAVHRFARDLRPAVLDDLGLVPALRTYCEGLAERKKLKIHLTADRAVEQLASDKRTVLFRVTQEALTNVARHAHASHVKLRITKTGAIMRLEISDNGKSFPVQKKLQAKGNKRLGLVGMRERVEMVGGTFTIESTPGQGTTVRADLPFTLTQETT
jgi:two-component system sensor histidine kinase DegS